MPVAILAERGRGTRPRSLAVPQRGRIDYRDAALPGLMVRVTAAGVKTYCVWFRLRRSTRICRITLGDVRATSLADARDEARGLLRKGLAGVDPREERRKAAEEVQRASLLPGTIEKLAEQFLSLGKTKRGRDLAPNTRALYTRQLRRHVYPALGRLAPASVTKADVRTVIDRMRATGHEVSANRTLQTLRRFFCWAVEQDILTASPCAGLKVTSEQPRERVLSNDELRAVAAAASGTAIQHLLPLILQTATRSHEARSAKWSDFDFEERLWRIPATKAGITHVLPLSQGALRVLSEVPRTDSGYVFPGHYSSRSKVPHMGPPQAAVEIVGGRSGVANWSLHDLRRTVRTRLPEVGATPDIAERVLGHVLGGMRRVYDRHDYVPQMMQALEAWSQELDRILRLALVKPGAPVNERVTAGSRSRSSSGTRRRSRAPRALEAGLHRRARPS